MVVHGHEEGIDHDTERDEELHERVEDNERNDLLKAQPALTTVPNAEDVYALEAIRDTALLETLLEARPIHLLSFCREIINGH